MKGKLQVNGQSAIVSGYMFIVGHKKEH